MNSIIKTDAVKTGMTFLSVPNTKFVKETGEYMVQGYFSTAQKDAIVPLIMAQVEPDIASLKVLHKLKNPKLAALPWQPATDRDKKIIPNLWAFKFSQKAVCGSGENKWDFKPLLIDEHKKDWDAAKIIGRGSTVKIAFHTYSWYVKGELGFSLKLDGVQVLDYRAGGRSAESLGFEDESSSVVSSDEIQKEFQKEEKQPEDKDTPIVEEDFMSQLRGQDSGK